MTSQRGEEGDKEDHTVSPTVAGGEGVNDIRHMRTMKSIHQTGYLSHDQWLDDITMR